MLLITLIVACVIYIAPCLAANCACATYELNVRNGPGTSHGILGSLHASNCVPYKNQQQTAEGYTWANIDFNDQSGWAATNWLNIAPCGGGSSKQQLPGCPRIISRAEWGARPPTHTIGHLPGVPKYVFIHHGASASCTTESSCKQKVREYQNYHLKMDIVNWPDIGYTFVIGEDGNVYEARGWDIIGAHTLNYNYNGLGFCIIGNFMTRVPNAAALNAVNQLIKCGVQNGKISTDYILRGHRDVNQTACPGDKLEALIKTWPHY